MKRTFLLSLLFVCISQSNLFSQCTGATVYACYDNNYSQVSIAEICPIEGYKIVTTDFVKGIVEPMNDKLHIYSGAAGSGTAGSLLATNLEGDLTGLSYSSLNDFDCISLIIDSNGSMSCDDSRAVEMIEICARPSAPLPVSLISFEASLTKAADQIVLNWSTASETNNAGFEIQKSADARSWAAIEWVAGNGTTNQFNEYRFVDAFPLNKISYYRLKQVDVDGRYEYSPVRSVRNIQASLSISLYPNPVQQAVNITIDNPGEQQVKVSLYSNLGQKIWEAEVEQGSKRWEKQLNIEQNGVYFLATEAGSDLQFEKIVVNK